ncbi:hypothetical protein GCM10017673_38800 [Streptosporangium violaceochromogenes]|nr:hypothetical protein GCM10017673_38800 [Streptosporangium violaceochromogenes]
MDQNSTPPPGGSRPVHLVEAFLKGPDGADPMALLTHITTALDHAEEDVKLLNALRALEMARLADKKVGFIGIAYRCRRTKGWVSQQIARARTGEALAIIETILTQQADRARRAADDDRLPDTGRATARRRAAHLGDIITRCVERATRTSAAKTGAAALTVPGWREWLAAKTAALTASTAAAGTTAAAVVPAAATEGGLFAAAIAKFAAATGTTATVAATATTVALAAAPAAPLVTDVVFPDPPAVTTPKPPTPATTPSTAPSFSPTSDSAPTTAGVGKTDSPPAAPRGPAQITEPPAIAAWPQATATGVVATAAASPTPAIRTPRPLSSASPLTQPPPTPSPAPSPPSATQAAPTAQPSPTPTAPQACAGAPTPGTPAPSAPACLTSPAPPSAETATTPTAVPAPADTLQGALSVHHLRPTWRAPRQARKRAAHPRVASSRQETIVPSTAWGNGAARGRQAGH